MVVGEHLGMAREDAALARVVEVRFDPRRATLLEGGEKREQQGQQFAIGVALPFGPLEGAQQALARELHRGQRVADDEGADRGAADRHQLVRQCLEDHLELAARDDEAAEYAAQDDQESDPVQHDLRARFLALTSRL